MRTVLACCVLIFAVPVHNARSQSSGWRKVFPGETPAVAINPQNPHSIYTFDGNLQVSYDNGQTWNARGSAPAPFRQLLVHPADTTLIFGAGSNGLQRSSNSGVSWENVLPELIIDGESIVIDAQRPDTMYAGKLSNGNIYRSEDRGVNWALVGSTGGGLCTLSIRPDSSNILFAGSGGGTIAKSTDHGVTWRQVHSSGSIEIPKIVVDRLHPLTAYATSFTGPDSTNGLLKTTDGGEHWQLMFLGGIALWALDVSPTNPDVIYTAAFGGPGTSAYRTTNGGAGWDTLNAGYPPGGASWNLKVSPTDPGTIWLALTGGSNGGVYGWLPTVGVGDTPPGMPDIFIVEQNYPNPFNPSTTIAFSLAVRSVVTLKIFDLPGREISTLVSEEMPAGRHMERWDATGLPAGVYFYRLQSGAASVTRKMLLVK